MTSKDYTPWMHPNIKGRGEKPKLKDLPPCTFGQPIIDYLNNATVREALHIPYYVGIWDMCNMTINEHYTKDK